MSPQSPKRSFQVLFLPGPQLGVRIQDLLYNWTTGILAPVPITLAMGSMGPPAPPTHTHTGTTHYFPTSLSSLRNWYSGTQVF